MSEVTIGVSKGDHKSGTKAYILVSITNRLTGESLLLRCWGKKDNVNRAKVEFFSAAQKKIGKTAAKEFQTAFKERMRKGYDMEAMISRSDVESLEDLVKLGVPAICINNIQNKQLQELWPGVDTTGFSRFGDIWDDQEEIKEQFNAAAEAERLAQKEAEMAVLKSNPFYGMF